MFLDDVDIVVGELFIEDDDIVVRKKFLGCLLYTSPSPRDS